MKMVNAIRAFIENSYPVPRVAAEFGADMGGLMISPDLIKVRYLYLNDSSRAVREKWIDFVFSSYKSFEYSRNATHFLSTAEDDYDMLLVGGNDVQRVARIVKENEAILRSKIKVCVLSFSSPARRAQIINAGYDDAIDVDRVSPLEGAVRVRAISHRYRAVREIQEIERGKSQLLYAVVGNNTLTPKEHMVLSKLVENLGRPVSTMVLRNLDEGDYHGLSVGHLKVIISNIRKKIKANYAITSKGASGYVMEKAQ